MRSKISPRDVSTGRSYKAPRGSWVDTQRLELFDQRQWTTRALARLGQYSESLDGWYNRAERHSPTGMLSPIDYEPAQAPVSTAG